MIELQSVTKRHVVGDVETLALNDVSLHIEAGEYVAITGPSGCGKTTLLSLLGLLDRPSSGRVLLQGEDMGTRSEAQLAGLRAGASALCSRASTSSMNSAWPTTWPWRCALWSAQPGAQRPRGRGAGAAGHRAPRGPPPAPAQRRAAAARGDCARHRRTPGAAAGRRAHGNLDSAHGAEVMRLLASSMPAAPRS